jgi:Tripartite tricarboxylate transporter TctB family
MNRAGVALLLVIVASAITAFIATPQLIQPFPSQAPWYESAASFPRAALLLVLLGGALELSRRRQQSITPVDGSDELDSSKANLLIALYALGLFCLYALTVPVIGFLVSTSTFLIACGMLVRLGFSQTLMIAIPLTLALWFVFVKLLKVSFGHGWLI